MENSIKTAVEYRKLAYDNEDVPAVCPMCGGNGNLLGNLGKKVHYRCQDCGMDFSKDSEVAGE